MSSHPPPMFDWMGAALEALRIPLQIQSWKQLLGLALMVGGIGATAYFILFAEPTTPDLRVPTNAHSALKTLERRTSADAIVVWRYDPLNSTLDPIYSTRTPISSDQTRVDGIPIDAAGGEPESSYVLELRRGNCQRLENKAVNDVGVRLPVLACGVFRGNRYESRYGTGRFAGIIAAAYTEFPKANPQADDPYDPYAYWLFSAGLDLAASQ